MGNMKLPWREVAAAVAGGVLVWAWGKRAGQPFSPSADQQEYVPVVARLADGGGDTPQSDSPVPPEVAEMLRAVMAQMMATPTRPQPLRDIHVHVDLNQYLVLIYVYSYFAAAWVQAEAPRFGTLLYPQAEQGPYVLLVNRVYHPGQVAGWLASGYGQEGERDGCTSVDSPG